VDTGLSVRICRRINRAADVDWPEPGITRIRLRFRRHSFGDACLTNGVICLAGCEFNYTPHLELYGASSCYFPLPGYARAGPIYEIRSSKWLACQSRTAMLSSFETADLLQVNQQIGLPRRTHQCGRIGIYSLRDVWVS